MYVWGMGSNEWGLCVYFLNLLKCEKYITEKLSWFFVKHTTKIR